MKLWVVEYDWVLYLLRAPTWQEAKALLPVSAYASYDPDEQDFEEIVTDGPTGIVYETRTSD